MTRYEAAIQAEELLGLPCVARRMSNENRDRRFLIGNPRANFAFWAASYEDILKHLRTHPDLVEQIKANWQTLELKERPAEGEA